MSRTRLTVIAALGLVLFSTAVFFTRRSMGGVDAGPPGTSAWEVTITVRGEFPKPKGANKGPRAVPQLALYAPPDFRRQHVSDVSWKSDELTRPDGRSGSRGPREKGVWKARPGSAPDTGYRLTYTFHLVLGAHAPSPAMDGRTKQLDAAPKGATDRTLKATPRIQSDRREVRELAARLGGAEPIDQFRAFHAHVQELPLKQDAGPTALDCLHDGGDDASKSRLVVALCRSKGIPARVVVGMVLNTDGPPTLHRWAEAWVATSAHPEPHWVPACPTYGHFGHRKWPSNYLVLRAGDGPVASGPGTPRVSLFARPLPDQTAAESPGTAFWRAVSFANLPPAEQHLVRFLVLLPVAAVAVSTFRVVIGVRTFGVFSPALLGLVFRDLHNLGWGLGIFAATVLVGWGFRKVLDRFHLLLIPRTAVLLTLIIGFLLVVMVVGARVGVQVSSYLSLFPLIILTNMVERFWTVEAEDGSWASFKTLIGTLLVAAGVALVLSPDAVGRTLFRFPEGLGVVLAVLLLLGRYTGYRLTELYRFRDVVEPHARSEPAIALYRVPVALAPEVENAPAATPPLRSGSEETKSDAPVPATTEVAN